VLSGATLDAPPRPGVYFLRRGGVRVGAVVVNPEPDESDLTRIPPRALRRHFNARTVSTFADADRWDAAVFDARAERPLAAFFIALSILLLIAESVVTRRRGARAGAAQAIIRRAA
jgi:hypothetical protein